MGQKFLGGNTDSASLLTNLGLPGFSTSNDNLIMSIATADGELNGFCLPITAADGVVIGDAVGINSSGVAVKTDADGTETLPLGIAAQANSSGGNAVINIMYLGTYKSDAFTFTIGDIIVTSTTAGGLRAEPASPSSGEVLHRMGQVIATDTVLIIPNMNNTEV